MRRLRLIGRVCVRLVIRRLTCVVLLLRCCCVWSRNGGRGIGCRILR